LGMLPSASLGEVDARTKRRKAMYEPVHGSAPDIAGKGMANPIAMLASFGMALRYSFNMAPAADQLDAAIAATLATGLRTADIKSEGVKVVSTAEMGAAIVAELERPAAWACSVLPENEIRSEILCQLESGHGHQRDRLLARFQHLDLHDAAIVAQGAGHAGEH